MNVCVAPCRCVCVFSRLLYAVVWHSLWQLWTFHGARTVREWGAERERGEGAGWRVRRGRGGKPRQKVGTECAVRLSGDGIRACMFWRAEVPACSPINTCWCVMKVRPVCGVKPYQRVGTAGQPDTVLVHGLKHHTDIYMLILPELFTYSLFHTKHDNHPDSQLLPVSLQNLNLFPISL